MFPVSRIRATSSPFEDTPVYTADLNAMDERKKNGRKRREREIFSRFGKRKGERIKSIRPRSRRGFAAVGDPLFQREEDLRPRSR